MLQVTPLKRVFIVKQNGREHPLPDPNTKWPVARVKDYYASRYPELTTAAQAEPTVIGRAIQYRFTTVLGTKG